MSHFLSTQIRRQSSIIEKTKNGTDVLKEQSHNTNAF
jgi:hypothetical protein